MHAIGFSGKFDLCSWYTCFTVFNRFDISLFTLHTTINMNSGKLKIYAFLLYQFELGNTTVNVVRHICVHEEDAVGKKIA